MRVYGDRVRHRDPRALIAALEAQLTQITRLAPGIVRHGAVVRGLVAAGELAQGLADAELQQRGVDAPSPVQTAAMDLCMALAAAVVASWDAGFDASGPLATDALERLAALPLPQTVVLKRPEGYAFYAVYPEAYAEAAAPLGPQPQASVIGLRSIGTSLAAMVAARLESVAPLTFRPVGPPFERTLALPGGEPAWRSAPLVCVVDEGPGLSGSSFGAVGDVLDDGPGQAPRVVWFPSHAGEPGPQASPRHRARWAAAERRLVSFDELAVQARAPPHRLQAWVADLVGEPAGPLHDLSGGGWRATRYRAEADWPPVNSFAEARKFSLQTDRGSWRLKFAGLDGRSLAKLDRSRRLAAAGFSPPVAGLRHGFLVEQSLDDAGPLELAAVARDALVARLADYLRFRRQAFPATPQDGASLGELMEMTRINADEALGAAAAARLSLDGLQHLEARVQRIWTDNRLHAWEWLVDRQGRVLKTDALDHADSHDLIGCQDVAWDVAGATVELGLSEPEAEGLRRRVGADAALTTAMCAPYLAFQLGAYSMAAQAHGHWPAEQTRLSARRDHYAAALDALTRRSG